MLTGVYYACCWIYGFIGFAWKMFCLGKVGIKNSADLYTSNKEGCSKETNVIWPSLYRKLNDKPQKYVES